MTHANPADRAGAVLERLGLVVALGATVFKVITSLSPLCGWELDPFTLPSPSTGIGPSLSMGADLAIIVGALAMLLGRRLADSSLPRLGIWLVAVGAAPLLYHLNRADATIADRFTGLSWLAALVLALALSHALAGPRGRRLRAIAGGVFLGVVALLAVRAVQQVYIEHPATLADFSHNKAAFLAAQGWTEDSPMARAYERRLAQPESTGWFGLANVVATFAAAGVVLSATLLLVAVRRRAAERVSPAHMALLALALALAGLLAFLAGSKGGIIAIALGAGVVAALLCLRSGMLPPRLRDSIGRLGGLVTTGALAATLLLIPLRGLLADRLSELSLHFRWFYMQAAARITLEHPLTGVGPDGFQQAYLLAKNPLSPEDVTSAHNMLLDWPATLGLLSLAWVVAWALWIRRAGGSVSAADVPAPKPGESDDKSDRWTLAAIVLLPTVGAISIDQAILTPDLAMTRLAGLVAFCVVGWGTLAVWRRLPPGAINLALAAAATTAAAHALIDVAGVWPNSVALLALLVGVAAAGHATRPPATSSIRASIPILAVGVVIVTLGAWPLTRVVPWERAMRAAAAQAQVVGDLNSRWAVASAGVASNAPGALDEARAIAAALASPLTPEPRSGAQIDDALRQLDLRTSRAVSAQLEALARRFPSEWKVRREAGRVKLREAALLDFLDRPEQAQGARAEAERIADSGPASRRRAPEWAWLALVRESLAQGGSKGEWLPRAAQAAEEAARLAPFDLEYSRTLMRLYSELGEGGKAAEWARRTLRLDDNMRYDRAARGLSPARRAEAERLAGAS